MSPGRFLQTYPAVLPQLASFHTPEGAGRCGQLQCSRPGIKNRPVLLYREYLDAYSSGRTVPPH